MNFLDTIYNLEGSDIEKRLKIRNEGFWFKFISRNW
jgi:hypothetical protein